jgi:hypothetical protein
MTAELSLDSTEIENLAGQINDAISGVMNVEQILEETADDVKKAGDLKTRAEQVKQSELIRRLFKTDNCKIYRARNESFSN